MGQATRWKIETDYQTWEAWAGGEGPADPFGTRWYISTVSGEMSGQEPRVDIMDKEGMDGSLEGTVTLPNKLITMEGWYMSPSQSAMYDSTEWFSGLLAGPSRHGMVIKGDLDGSRVREAPVRRGGPSVASPYSPTGGNFSLSVVTTEPTWRSDERETVVCSGGFDNDIGMAFPMAFPTIMGRSDQSRTRNCVNKGNTFTSPQIIFHGPVTNPRITHLASGRFIQVNIVLGSSDFLVVDMDQMTVTYNNAVSRYDNVTNDSQWFSLAPGDNTVTFSFATSTTAASMAVSYFHRWS